MRRKIQWWYCHVSKYTQSQVENRPYAHTHRLTRAQTSIRTDAHTSVHTNVNLHNRAQGTHTRTRHTKRTKKLTHNKATLNWTMEQEKGKKKLV